MRLRKLAGGGLRGILAVAEQSEYREIRDTRAVGIGIARGVARVDRVAEELLPPIFQDVEPGAGEGNVVAAIVAGHMLAMCSVAVFGPSEAGRKRTVKVVLANGVTGEVALAVTVKAELSTPSIVMPRPVRFAVPVF